MEMRQNSFHRVFYLFIIETKSIKNDTRNARNVFWNDARARHWEKEFLNNTISHRVWEMGRAGHRSTGKN